MPMVNLKRERQTQDRGRDVQQKWPFSHYPPTQAFLGELVVGRDEQRAPLKTLAWEVIFTLETGDSRETGYPFNNSRQISNTS